jgi:hypothetical protein
MGRTANIVFWSIIATLVLVVGGFLTLNGLGEGKIEKACKEAVEADLKAPGTAEWVDVELADAGETTKVTGKVDAENSYGAKVRGTFSCTVDDNNVVIDHSVSEQ